MKLFIDYERARSVNVLYLEYVFCQFILCMHARTATAHMHSCMHAYVADIIIRTFIHFISSPPTQSRIEFCFIQPEETNGLST